MEIDKVIEQRVGRITSIIGAFSKKLLKKEIKKFKNDIIKGVIKDGKNNNS